MVDQEASGGLRNYFQSVGFSAECGGASEGTAQSTNLGDGRGWGEFPILEKKMILMPDGTVNQTAVIRWDYGNPAIGTCLETIDGGNHFRYWVQSGPDADSGAYFLA